VSERDQTVAGLLSGYRVTAGWPTLRQIAAMTGLSTALCGNVLSGAQRSSLASVTKIAVALGGDVTAVQDCWLHPPQPAVSFDEETRLMESFVQSFERLSVAARIRVIRYLISRFSIQLS